MKTCLMRITLAGIVFAVATFVSVESTNAQCATCVTPTVAYQPVVVQQVAVPQRDKWYPGKYFDRMRLRRYTAAAPLAYTNTGYAVPSYTASYAPYTASYAPYTAGYTPYVTAYAPLTRTVARPLVQTSYYVPSPCSSCVQTVARQVVLSPVLSSCGSTCGIPSCGGCSACSGVSQAGFTQAPCSNCAPSVGQPSYPTSPAAGGSVIGAPTPQPQLSPDEAAPIRSNYPAEDAGSKEKSIIDPVPQADGAESNTSTLFEAPPLLNLNPPDRTARRSSTNRPTVDVRNAIYRKSNSVGARQISFKQSRTQAEIDADGWHAVSQSR